MPARSASSHRFRQLLAHLGPTWGAAPARRIIQSLSLAVFLGLLFYVCWPYGLTDYALNLRQKELLPAETFLKLDPLLSLSTALAARAWVAALAWTAIVFGLGLFFPRGFCGFICPLGTLIDGFDATVGRHCACWRVHGRGWWVHLKYYLLTGTLVAALLGVTLSGFVAAMPVVTRGLQFIIGPLELGLLKGWYLIPSFNAGHWISLAFFLVVLGLGLLRPRFWCRFVCPTGALFSIATWVRLRERKTTSACSQCGRCVASCPFEAIHVDISTRTADCALCETCAGACPKEAIRYTARWHPLPPMRGADAEAVHVALSRRGFLAGTLSGVAGAIGANQLFGAKLDQPGGVLPVRPPGSVPEREFLQLCIRCAECFQACPNNVLQPLGFEQGLEGLWTPQVVARWSGCEPTCNNCGQVCPTGAIRPLPIEEKRAARIGLAIVNTATCLPHAQREACQLCVDECKAAGYDAIEFQRVGTQIDTSGVPIEGSGFLAPVVLADRCVGCGLCETRCFKINFTHKRLLNSTAIRIHAGPGKDDRLSAGSYRSLHETKHQQKTNTTPANTNATNDNYLPDFLK